MQHAPGVVGLPPEVRQQAPKGVWLSQRLLENVNQRFIGRSWVGRVQRECDVRPDR
jgi:hypothetical protein